MYGSERTDMFLRFQVLDYRPPLQLPTVFCDRVPESPTPFGRGFQSVDSQDLTIRPKLPAAPQMKFQDFSFRPREYWWE